MIGAITDNMTADRNRPVMVQSQFATGNEAEFNMPAAVPGEWARQPHSRGRHFDNIDDFVIDLGN